MARKSILVVDDEKSQREILDMILSGEGYKNLFNQQGYFKYFQN